MTYSIAISTVDRPYRQEFFERLAVTGTLAHPLVKGFHVSYDRGPNESAHHAMKAAAGDQSDFIIFLEDDIDILNDFVSSIDSWMQDVLDPHIHVYPLGCGAQRALRRARTTGHTSWRWPLKDYFGTCGLVMRREDALDFIYVYETLPELYPAEKQWMVRWNCMDVNLREWHRRIEPEQTYLVTPTTCFIQHQGVVSSLSTEPSHWTGTFQNWQGRDFIYGAGPTA
mgnify:CR=1 FL=1